MDSLASTQQASTISLDRTNTASTNGMGGLAVMFNKYVAPPHHQAGTGISPETSPEHVADTIESGSQGTPGTGNNKNDEIMALGNRPAARVQRNRRRRRRSSSGSRSESALPGSEILFATDWMSSANKTILTEGLLKIYHDSFENALACWLTERTCPYSTKADISLANETGPSWNRIYHRVFRLDRLTSSIRGRQLTFDEDKAVSKALNLSIFSFATQWAQSSQKNKARYPFHSDQPKHKNTSNGDVQESRNEIEFDRTMQVAAWHKARAALQAASKIESFRVVLAQIVFALTQKPIEGSKTIRSDDGRRSTEQQLALDLAETEDDSTIALDPDDTELSDCEGLMSKLNLAIDAEGPSIHLEQGLRLIHSLRSRMAMCGDGSRPGIYRGGKQYQSSAHRLDAADRATVDLLFWLGVMFDTLSSAMHKRPLVISDEDSDVYTDEPKPPSGLTQEDVGAAGNSNIGIGWDEHLFAYQSARLQLNPVRWPCTLEEAAALLCDAAPVKVLLFRKITRIQTLLARKHRGETVETSIRAALGVYNHWEKLYAPFVRDCIHNHDGLPSQVQSWYVCLTGHWHFAALLLADLIQIVDDSGLGTEVMQAQRGSCELVAHFRERNCQTLSDLARCACPRDDAESRDPHLAVSERALLTEPWTAVLIRAFARAGVILLESENMLPYHSSNIVWTVEEAFRRADDCVRALWYLGRRSDMALAAAKILGDALKQRRKGAREKLDRMTSFLEAELWQGFADVGETFGLDHSWKRSSSSVCRLNEDMRVRWNQWGQQLSVNRKTGNSASTAGAAWELINYS
jgi:hypothetical protein